MKFFFNHHVLFLKKCFTCQRPRNEKDDDSQQLIYCIYIVKEQEKELWFWKGTQSSCKIKLQKKIQTRETPPQAVLVTLKKSKADIQIETSQHWFRVSSTCVIFTVFMQFHFTKHFRFFLKIKATSVKRILDKVLSSSKPDSRSELRPVQSNKDLTENTTAKWNRRRFIVWLTWERDCQSVDFLPLCTLSLLQPTQ